jgi:hypothetical protein
MSSPRVIERARSPLLQAGAIALGCVAIAAQKPTLISAAGVLAVGCLGITGARGERTDVGRWVGVTAAGCAAFVLTRIAASSVAPSVSRTGLVMLGAGAVAEELFFRRYIYGFVHARAGAAGAVVASAVLFALVHVPTYGPHILPLDLAAGLLLGWQRWASGTWTSSAVTHTVANFLLERWI